MPSIGPLLRLCQLLGIIAVLLSVADLSSAQTIGPNLNVSRMPADKTEPGIAIDPTHPDRLFIAANIQDGNGLFAAFSTDTGATWTYTDPVDGVIADGTDGLPESCCDASVSVAADSFGNIFLVYLKTAGPSGIVVTISTDGGQSFRHLATLAVQDAVDQPTVATGCAEGCASGSVWVTYRNASLPNAPVVAQGAAVTGPDQVGSFGPVQIVPGSAGGNFGDIAIGLDGEVLVTFQTTSPAQGPSSILVSLDPDGLGPAGFSASTVVTQTRVGVFDSIPAQPDRGIDAEAGLAFDKCIGSSRLGRAYLIYTDRAATGSADTDILVRYSDNLGATWSTAIRVNDGTEGRSQFFPRIAVDSTSGNVAASWYDCRNDAGDSGPSDRTPGPNNDSELYAGVSRNGGLSWFPNMKISAGPSAEAASGNPNDFGEYTALAFHGGNLYPVWSDNSNSTGDNPAGATSAEIYTARVTIGLGSPVIRGAGAELISETCAPGNGVLDPNEPVTVSFALENIGESLTANLVATLLPTGGVLNPGGPQAYGALAAGDSPQAHSYSFIASGACGGTVTATLALTDGGASFGNVSFTFPLGLLATNAQGYSNAAPITIADNAAASSYPSVVHVANVTGRVTQVTVTLHSLSHTYASDLDIILVGPGGQSVMLMSDAGGSKGIQGTITFDDNAPVLPGSTAITTGSYAPYNYQDLFADLLPAPAPAAATASSLAAFKGINPNGDWQLYVVDDADGDIGAIAGGWSVQLSSPRAACCVGGPLLSIAPTSTGVVVSWPTALPGYALESAPTLNPSAVWSPVTTPVIVSNNLNTVSMPRTGASRFFRLRK